MQERKKVVVTGAAGYIGGHVVESLLNLGVEVLAVDSKSRITDPRVKSIDANIFGDHDNIFEVLDKPDVVIHLAWRDGFIHNSDAHLMYLYPHYSFLTNLIDAGLKHLVVMGTMHEVGYYEGEIDENTPTNPYSLYGVAKNSLRQALEVYLKDKDINFQWLRAFYIYGDDTKNKSIFSKIIQAEREGKKKFPFTSGKNKYDFIRVEELARQIALCSLQKEVTGIINCCSGEPVSLRDKVEEFIRNNNFGITLDYGAFPDRPYDSPAIWGNVNKINKIMNKF